MNAFVEATWDEVGARVRPLRRTVFVRTEPIEKKTPGGIWLPPSEQDAYGGPMHLRIWKGVVLAAGPRSILQPGERVCFQRQYLARWKVCADGTFVGWLDETQIFGTCDADVNISKFVTGPKDSRVPVVM